MLTCLQSRVGAAVVGSIVSLQAAEISRAVEHYTELQAQVEVGVHLWGHRRGGQLVGQLCVA